ILMPTAWVIFVFWLIVWRIAEIKHAPSPRESLLLGLLVGVTATAVATILFLIPLVLAATWIKPRKIDNRIRAAFAALVLLLGVFVGTALCWVHNYFIARDPVVLSAHSGINFWIGNNPDANGYPRFPPGLRAGQAALLHDSITGAESAVGHPLKHGEVSAFWTAKARRYIASHPIEWLRLLAVKFRNLWSAFQYDDLSIINALSAAGVLFPGISFGLVAALGLPGIILFWQNAPRSRVVVAAMFLQVAALLPVFV